MKDKNYYPDGEPKRCKHCRSKQLKEVVEEVLDYTVSQKSVYCKICNQCLGFWAYGYWQS